MSRKMSFESDAEIIARTMVSFDGAAKEPVEVLLGKISELFPRGEYEAGRRRLSFRLKAEMVKQRGKSR